MLSLGHLLTVVGLNDPSKRQPLVRMIKGCQSNGVALVHRKMFQSRPYVSLAVCLSTKRRDCVCLAVMWVGHWLPTDRQKRHYIWWS